MPPNSTVFRRRSGSSGVGVGGGGVGASDVASAADGFASVSMGNMGIRGAGAGRGGEGGNLGCGEREGLSTDALIASFASPPGVVSVLSSPFGPAWPPPAPHVGPLLTAYLKVVDYVLRKPFSDETFRLLLEATEIDHRRVSAHTRSFVPLRVAKMRPCDYSSNEFVYINLLGVMFFC